MNEATSELLADANDIVREQLALAWAEHIERVRDVLEAQWPERMERVLEETVAGLAARLEEEHQDALQARIQQANRTAEKSRRELIQKLTQVTRRLRSFEDERHWSNTLVDGTRGFCGRAALFLIRDRKLYLETTRNFDDADLAEEVPLDAAPAFVTAIETRDTLVALRSSSELSEPVAAYLGEAPEPANAKCYLFPVVTRHQVAAVLYVDSGDVDVDALELLVATAGAVLNAEPVGQPVRVTGVGRVTHVDQLVSILPLGDGQSETAELQTAAAQAVPSQKHEILSWFSLSREDRELHLRAQRFARVKVAEIRLYQSENVKNGRAAHDLYTSLKVEIDSARDAFRSEFLNASDSMVDYLHLELVRTLANDDAAVLGQDYPGPMV
jgi:vacuolar-type H+-ATPase subunit D/Vma8